MRCDKCKHWNKASNDNRVGWEAQRAEFGECTAVRTRWAITNDIPSPWMQDDTLSECAREAYEAAKTAALKSARAYVQDGSDYMADLVTGPDFGCVLFEQQ